LSLLIDLAIVAILIYAAVGGYFRGMILVLVDLLGLILSTVLASFTYRYLAPLLVKHFNMVPSFSEVTSFLLIMSVVAFVYALAGRQLLRHIPHRVVKNPINLTGGAVLNAIRALLIIAVFLIIFAGMPISSAQKQVVAEARIPKVLLAYSGRLQTSINRAVGSTIKDTLNFLTVENKSEDSINLGFKTTRVRVDPATEEAMLVLVNRERTSRGLKPLTMNQTAREVARLHSRDMFARGYFSHVNPDGEDPFDRMERGGVEFSAAGENLALAPTLQLAHEGLMNSPGHRANILSPDFGTVGIGVIEGGPYGLMFTQNFTD
jgi:uncharacterized protein YkwD